MQLMLVLLPIVGLPIIATGYVLRERAHVAFLEEKQEHLQGINALLAQHLAGRGGYAAIIAGAPELADDRQRTLAHLNSQLRDYCDNVARAFPGVGVGYFHLGLNAIITYGPSEHYENTVGMTIPTDHPGWKVMHSGTAMTVSGGQVRGNIMNAMLPIKESGEVVGYIWANEFSDAIEEQAKSMRFAVQTMTLVGFGLSLIVMFFVIAQLTSNMEKIKSGLLRLRFNLGTPIPPIKGEIGEIVEAINGLAQSLLETRSMHNNILDSLADAVITVDSENFVSYINPAGCELFQCDAAEVVGKPYPTLFRPDVNFRSPIVDTLQTGCEHRGIELDYPLPHRTPRVLSSTSLLFDGRGTPLGVVAIIRDVSERYALQRQVAQSERLALIGEMAAGIAHELRTPLTSIRGFVQYLQGSSNPAEWREYGDIIVREVDGLNRIVSDLLDLVRPLPLQLLTADINVLVGETILLAREAVSGARIAFTVNLDHSLPPIRMDRGRIKQVLLNILVNAVQSINRSGEIIITTVGAERQVRLSVADSGCGIPEALQKRIFDPFFSTKPSGTGLGMAIARRIVEDHDGTIEIDSIEGQGCSVTLILPISQDTKET
jgi:two-component system, NtrC family, sensor histidine kinase AtoS